MQFRITVPATPFGIGLINPESASWLTRDTATEGDLMSHTRRRLLSTAMLGAASAVTGACSGHRPGPNEAKPLEKVTYLTGLGAFGREAFAWVAAAKGHFRDAGLRGKTIAQAEGAVVRTLFPGYARLAGIDPNAVHWVEVAATNLPALLASGKVDAIGQFVVGKPAVAAAAKRPVDEVVTLPYSTYMTDPYGNALVTSKHLTDTRPDLVRQFTNALLQGLVYTVANPEEAGRILHT